MRNLKMDEIRTKRKKILEAQKGSRKMKWLRDELMKLDLFNRAQCFEGSITRNKESSTTLQNNSYSL